MLLASYKSTRPGIQGIANRVIRWRLRGDARLAAIRARFVEGDAYDWPGVAGFVWWPIRAVAVWWSCAELCAQALGMAEPWRQDPCSLHRVAAWANRS